MIPKVLLAVKLDPLLDRDEADLAMEPGPPATAPAPGRRDAGHAIRVSTKLESGITPLTVQTISQPKSTNGIRNLLQRHLAVC